MKQPRANKIRVINYNIKGAKAPGRKDHAAQQRAWHLLAAYGADIALVQEAEIEAIPEWAKKRWLIVHGEPSKLGGSWAGWGSVIAARDFLNPRAGDDFVAIGTLRLLYDYAVFAEVHLPDGGQAFVSTLSPQRDMPRPKPRSTAP